MNSSDKMLKTLKSAVSAGARAIKAEGKKALVIKEKSPNDFVTNCDIASESAIISALKKDYPDSAIHSEEIGDISGTGDLKWVIDPLDGTHNFMHCLPMYGISIAAQKGEKIIAGIIHLPEFNATYHALAGKGAFLNDKKISVSKRSVLAESFITFTNQFEKDPRIFPAFQKILKKCFTIRVLGSAVFDSAKVADGSIDARIFHRAKLVDVAAASLIVQEAGGSVTNFNGNPFTPETTDLIVSNGKIHNELVEILSKQ